MNGTLVFDGNCGFCTRSRNLLVRLDRHHRIHTLAYQQPHVPPQFGIDRDQLARAAYWFDADGTHCSGAAAINSALSAALGTQLPLQLYRLPGIHQLQDTAYHWIATHRHRLPGTTPWCHTYPNHCH